MKTFIRVQDAFAQFDHPKDAPLPEGVSKVGNANEHVGLWAREPKRRTDKAGKPAKREAQKPPVGDGRETEK